MKAGSIRFSGKRIAKHLQPYRVHVFWLCASGLGVALVDVLLPYFTALLIDEAAQNGITERLKWLGFSYAALCVFLCVQIFVFIDLAGRIATGIGYDLRREGFSRLQKLDFSYFDHRPTGWLVTRLTSDCAKVSDLIPWFFLDLAWGASFLIGIVLAMLFLHWKLALVVMIIVPPLFGISIFFQKRLLKSSRAVRKTNSEVTASLNECIMGVRTTEIAGSGRE